MFIFESTLVISCATAGVSITIMINKSLNLTHNG